MATDLRNSSDNSVTSLVKGIVDDAQELLKQQFTLLKVEVRQDLRQTGEAVFSLVLGLVVLFIGTILLSVALVHLLYWAFPTVPLWVWFLVVGGLITGAGLGLGYFGLQRFRSFNPLPDQTLKGLEENLEWKTKPR